MNTKWKNKKQIDYIGKRTMNKLRKNRMKLYNAYVVLHTQGETKHGTKRPNDTLNILTQ